VLISGRWLDLNTSRTEPKTLFLGFVVVALRERGVGSWDGDSVDVGGWESLRWGWSGGWVGDGCGEGWVVAGDEEGWVVDKEDDEDGCVDGVGRCLCNELR